MRNLGISLAIVAVIVIGLWAIGQSMGFRMSLIPSLALSVALTVGLNLLLNAGRWMGRRRHHPR